MLAYGSLCRGLLTGKMTEASRFPAMTCARAIQSFRLHAFSNISKPSPHSTGSRRSATENASSILRRVGFSIATTRALRSGAHAGPIN